jgi:L-arabinose isomerase
MLAACADKKAQQKVLLDDIIKIHDKVMSADEQLMNNKMKLDTLIKTKTIPDTDKSAKQLVQQLNSADVAMENWMHKFDPDDAENRETMALSILPVRKN